jgi:hypothetical protein
MKDFLPVIIYDMLNIYKVILAGGALRAYLNKEEISDYDLFFFNEEEKNYVKDWLLSKKFKIVFECSEGKLITFKKKRLKIQLITEKYYKDIDELLNSFDLTVTQFALYGGNLYTVRQALKDTYNKKIRFNKITYPSATLGRFYKFQNKGYHLDSVAKKDFIARLLTKQDDIVDLNRVYID